MKELAALAVLTMPLLAFLCIGGLAGFAGWAAARRVSGALRKWTTSVIAISAVLLVFAWDEIAGRVYFHYLCATEGGARIQRQIRLPAEYWDVQGNPIFLDANGNKVASKLDEGYLFRSESDENFSVMFRIRKYVHLVLDRHSGELIATHTSFAFFGGWLEAHTSLNESGVGCRTERNYYVKFLRMIFNP